MYFVELQKRLIAAARQRIRAGHVTERRLAALSRISQPHMHNVLAGIRSITFDSADKILRGLDLTIPDLLGQTEEVAARQVPVLSAPVGPGREANFSLYGGYLPVSAELLRETVDAVLARLGPDLALPPAFAAGDLVLLDQNPALRGGSEIAGYWVIADGGGLRVCHLTTEKNQVFISHPDGWHAFAPLGRENRGRPVEDLLKARVIWMAREITRDPDFRYPDKPRGPRAPFSPS